jgi:catechol 2,3-dioxygenase-like lactoylglutathione lyase family enzyme
MTELELGIISDDAEALVRFYCDGFGFEPFTTVSFPQGTVHRLRRGTAGVKIYQPAATPERLDLPEPWESRTGMGYGALLVDDIAPVAERAVAAGATLMVPVTRHRPGAAFALVRDPEGNVWEILQETLA